MRARCDRKSTTPARRLAIGFKNNSMINKTTLLLSGHRAMLFNIIPAARFITINISAPSALQIFVYSDRLLSSNEKDIYYSMSGEICGDFPELDDSKSEVIFIVTTEKFESIKVQGELIYVRNEINLK